MGDALKGQSERDGYLLQQHGINVGEKEAGGAVDRVQYYIKMNKATEGSIIRHSPECKAYHIHWKGYT